MKKVKESIKVSVILTTFNRAKIFLPRAIKSVLDQGFKDFELIIIDDASKDGTSKLVRAVMKRDKRVKYIRHKKNFGSDTRGKNEGLLASKGEYIAYLDDDNEWLPYHLEKLINKLDKNPKLDLVFGDMWIFDQDKPEWEGMQGITVPKFDAQFLLNRCYIDTSEVMHRRDLAFAVGGWDETLPKFVDWNLWVRMAKWGARMQRVPVIITNYYINPKQKSKRVESKSWIDDNLGISMFEPSFDPAGCKIYLRYLGNDRKEEKNPRVAIFTLSYNRLDYTKRTAKSMRTSTKYPFDWFVWDNGSKDGSAEWLEKEAIDPSCKYLKLSKKNVGISRASNGLIDVIKSQENPYDIIIKVDNDCEFMTYGWLESLIDLWKRNHLLYMTPYPEGLVHNPGGAPRVGYSYIGPYFVEVSYHVSGLCAAVDAKAYDKFRWQDRFLHGNQDREASIAFNKLRYMPCYIPLHRVLHMDTTTGQHKKYKKYFKNRIEEKRIQI